MSQQSAINTLTNINHMYFLQMNVNLQFKTKMNKKRHLLGIKTLENAWDKIKNLNLTTSNFPANFLSGEDVSRLRLQRTSLRRLQDLLIKTNMFTLVIRLQKTYLSNLDQDEYIRLTILNKTFGDFFTF